MFKVIIAWVLFYVVLGWLVYNFAITTFKKFTPYQPDRRVETILGEIK